MDIGTVLILSATPVILITIVATRIIESRLNNLMSEDDENLSQQDEDMETNSDYVFYASAAVAKRKKEIAKEKKTKQTLMHNLRFTV